MATIVSEVQLNEYCKYQIGYDLVSQSIVNNTSTVVVYGFLVVTGSYVSWSSGTAEVWGNVDTLDTYYSQGTYTVVAKELGLAHDSNGNCSTYLTGSITTNYLSGSTSGLMTLPKISRIGIVNSANDFTDEENPKMNISNAGGYQINVRLEIHDDNNVLHVIHQVNDVTTVGDFEFELTSAERNELRQCCTGQTMNVRYVVATCVNSQDETNWEWLDRTMTIVNANPTLTYSVEETNANVIAMLGSSSGDTIINNASILEFDITPTAYKYATISKVMCGNKINANNAKTVETSPYEISLPVNDDNLFYIIAYDSRGFVGVEDNIQKTMIDYNSVAINTYSFKRHSPISADVIFNGEFRYWGDSVGTYTNTPVVKWKLDNGNWNTIPSTNYSIDANNHKLIIYNYTISNVLAYTAKGQFSISIEDSLTSMVDTSESGLVLRGVPTFEAGETDFQVNGDLIIADTQRDNPINVREKIECLYDITTDGGEVKLPYKIDGKDVFMKRLSTTRYSGTMASLSANIPTYTKIWIDTGQSYVVNNNSNIFIGLFQYGSPTDFIRAYFFNGSVSVFFGSDWSSIPSDIVVTLIYQKT